MEIAFASATVSKLCNNDKELRKLGDRNASLLRQRFAEFVAVDTLADLGKMPGPKCHELKAGRKGQLAVSLAGSMRLIFVPGHNPSPIKPDGGLDWEKVTRVTVIEVVDYH